MWVRSSRALPSPWSTHREAPLTSRNWTSWGPLLCNKRETTFILDFRLCTKAFCLLLLFIVMSFNNLLLLTHFSSSRFKTWSPWNHTTEQSERQRRNYRCVLPHNASDAWPYLWFPTFLFLCKKKKPTSLPISLGDFVQHTIHLHSLLKMQNRICYYFFKNKDCKGPSVCLKIINQINT